MPTKALLCIILLLTFLACTARADLHEYVKRPEPSFAWKLKEKIAHPLGTVYDLQLTSQTWQGIAWQHQIHVYQPKDVAPNATMLLWNTGGSGNANNQLFGLEMARRVKAPVAFLYNIPNQPLFDGKKEDALIAETFVRYLDTKDGSWPLLFPMVKSVIKAMDAIQSFSAEELKLPVKQFIVAGASKRGWTSWLSAATGDPRIKAIVPLVIDTLNMQQQMPHQLATLGQYSEMIKDYTERGLVPMPNTPEAKRLWSWVDPWVYRDRLTLPKFLIHGSNDPYWSTDATNLYWDSLTGDKWLLYVPNAGHDLRQKERIGLDQVTQAVSGLAAFVRSQSEGKPLPRIQWKHDDVDGKPRITVEATPAPSTARLWVALAPTLDFRKAKWVEHPASVKGGTVTGMVDSPKEGCQAFFAELDYALDDMPYKLSTQMRVVGKPQP